MTADDGPAFTDIHGVGSEEHDAAMGEGQGGMELPDLLRKTLEKCLQSMDKLKAVTQGHVIFWQRDTSRSLRLETRARPRLAT